MSQQSHETVVAPHESDGRLDLAREELSRNGFTVLADQLPSPVLALMRDALDSLRAADASRFVGNAACSGGDGPARALLEDAPVFLELLRLSLVDSIVDATLGPAALVLQQTGIVLPPRTGQSPTAWRRDLPYQGWVASKPLALGAVAVLDDFSARCPVAWFLPGSHRHALLPGAAYAQRWAHAAAVLAGSVVVFDAMCFHAGGVNQDSYPRRAVTTLFGIPLLTQQAAFTPKPDMDARLRRRLGLDYQTAPDADAWRAARHARLHGAGS